MKLKKITSNCTCCINIIPQRYILIGLLIFITTVLFGMRNIENDCLVFVLTGNPIVPWDQKKNTIASMTFYLGYAASQIPFGFISDKYGPKYILLSGLTTSSFLTLISPLIITLPSWWFLVILKLGMGIAHAACIPAIFCLISNWASLNYITSYTSLTFLGVPLGRCLSTSMTYYFLTKIKNWRGPFYFWGTCGLLSTFLTAIFVYSRPAKHPCLSELERQLFGETGNLGKTGKISWAAVLGDPAIWANVTGQVAYHWLVNVMYVNVPHYLVRISNVQVNTLLAVISSCLCLSMTIVASGFASDYLIRHRYMPTIFLRAIFYFVGSVVGSLVMVMNFSTSIHMAIICVTVSVAFTGPMFSGLHTNVFDLTRNFAGTIEGIVNGFGSITGIFSELIWLYISPEYSVDEWKRLNWFSLALSFFCSIVFFIWVRTKSASWDLIERSEPNEE